jgi:hypothetical protein
MMRNARPIAGAALLAGLGATASSAFTPAVDYALNCQGCHRADGAGTSESVPALADSVARFLAAPGGRAYLVQVPGVAQAPLDDGALAALLNWMLVRFDPGNMPPDFTPYSGEEVGTLRKTPLTAVDDVRRRLLEVVDRPR